LLSHFYVMTTLKPFSDNSNSSSRCHNVLVVSI
jgi:hypothetical protein